MKTVNTQGTSGRSLTDVLPCPLRVARNRVGANTDEGRLYSGMIEASQSYRNETSPTARAHLVEYMAWCRDQLARRLTAFQ